MANVKKKVLISGSTGYIGSFLVRKFLSEGWDVTIIVRRSSNRRLISDLTSNVTTIEYMSDLDQLILSIGEIKPDLTIHLAAYVESGSIVQSIDDIIQGNITFGLHLVEALIRNNSFNFINTGTYWQNFNNEEYNPVNLYAASKQAFANMLKYYIEAKGLSVITLKLFDVYGPRDPRPKLIPKLESYVRDGNVLERIELSYGEQYLDMVHIEDVCNAYLKASDYVMSGIGLNQTFAVNSGMPIRLRELINLIEKSTKICLPINFGKRPYREREIMTPVSCIERLPEWKPLITLEEGLTNIFTN